MTKRRRWSSELIRQAAALACSLLLLVGPSTVWATGKKQALPKAGHHKALKDKKPSKSAPSRMPGEEVVQAEPFDDSELGLRGHASFYGQGFAGRKTATGEVFDPRRFSAASNRFPLGTTLSVQRLDTGRCAIVRVNDRMAARHRKRVIDVSRAVAEYLEMVQAGVVLVRVAHLRRPSREQDQADCERAFKVPLDCVRCGQPEKSPKLEFSPEE